VGRSAMQTNALPHQDLSDRPTGCCPRFDPAGWDGVELHFRDKRFIRAETRSAMHLPLNMSKVFGRVHAHIEAAGGYDPDNTIVLSRDLSPWKAEHLFATEGDVPDEDATTLSGDFVTKVFDGPYNEAKSWYGEMEDMVRAQGKEPARIYFYYTTCPRCAKAMGHNYVVGVAEI
jgi:hypothetical protein